MGYTLEKQHKYLHKTRKCTEGAGAEGCFSTQRVSIYQEELIRKLTEQSSSGTVRPAMQQPVISHRTGLTRKAVNQAASRSK